MEEIYTQEFKQQFWIWFDGLPRSEKARFWTFPSDMAELFFYNKIYRHRERDNCPVV